MKHLINNATQGTELPWVTLDGENIVHYSGGGEIYSYEFVDLGLPSGLLWATCNVGATKPEESGLYFQWGATVGYEGDDALAHSTLDTYPNIPLMTTLDADHDAATANMGGDWRMPTVYEVEELWENTIMGFNTINDVFGMTFTNKRDSSKYIFIPAAGYIEDNDLVDDGVLFANWSSSAGENHDDEAIMPSGETMGRSYVNAQSKYLGVPVRAVLKNSADFELLTRSFDLSDTSTEVVLANNAPKVGTAFYIEYTLNNKTTKTYGGECNPYDNIDNSNGWTSYGLDGYNGYIKIGIKEGKLVCKSGYTGGTIQVIHIRIRTTTL